MPAHARLQCAGVLKELTTRSSQLRLEHAQQTAKLSRLSRLRVGVATSLLTGTIKYRHYRGYYYHAVRILCSQLHETVACLSVRPSV